MTIYLREVRKHKGMTIIELEELSGVSRAEISNIENGVKNPRIGTLCVLAKALQVPVTDLFSCD